MGQNTISVTYRVDGELLSFQHELRELRETELMIKVTAAGLNRADVLQRHGTYKAPYGETEVPGIEIVGIVTDVGTMIKNVQIGDRVCGVVGGGGFSAYCILDSEMAIKVPETWSDLTAAAFPEAALTANEALIQLGQVKPQEWVLIHAASSGIGTMIVMMAKALNAKVVCTTTSPDKEEFLYQIGADFVIAGKGAAFVESILDITEQKGVDLIIDFLAGQFFNSNIAALKAGGKLVMAGILDSAESQANWIPLINKYITIHALTLRMKPLFEKRAVTKRFIDRWWDGVAYGPLHPVVHSEFSLLNLNAAQLTMLANRHVGKIVIKM